MKWCDRTLIRAQIRYRLCLSEQEFYGVLRWLNLAKKDWPQFLANPDLIAEVHTFKSNKGNHYSVVCTRYRKDESPISVVRTLIHEAVHIWQRTTEYMEEREPSMEFEAYAIENIAGNLIEEYGRRLKRRIRRQK